MDIIKIDQEDFGINNNKFCNYILEKLKFNRKIETEKLLQAQGRTHKKIIQFDLNVNNKEIYYDILKSNEVEIEAEYFRELFEIYCSKFKYQRELFIYEDKLKSILDAIKDENKLKLYFSEQVKGFKLYIIFIIVSIALTAIFYAIFIIMALLGAAASSV